MKLGKVPATNPSLSGSADADLHDRLLVRPGEADAQGAADANPVAREVRAAVGDDLGAGAEHDEALGLRQAPHLGGIAGRRRPDRNTEHAALGRAGGVRAEQRLDVVGLNLQLAQPSATLGCMTNAVSCAPTSSAAEIASANGSRSVNAEPPSTSVTSASEPRPAGPWVVVTPK